MSEVKRKTLPEIATFVGLENSQSLHHFLTESPWEIEALREQRLQIILKGLQGRKIRLIIDETPIPYPQLSHARQELVAVAKFHKS